MKLAEIKTLYEYNYWANHKLLTAAAGVTNDQFIASGSFPFGGLRGTLVHILDAEYGWGLLLQHGKFQTEELKEFDFPGLPELEKRWQSEERLMRAYLASLDDNALEGIIRYTADSGAKRERVLWHCLFHVVNHGTQHRSEAAAILTELGQSPGDVDFTVFLNERK
jgi:uncharacterized damage-inducible protein DinB